MDRSEAKAIVDREIESLQERLGIPHWSIVIDYDLRKSSEGYVTRGICEWRVDYNKASISLDPDCLDDEAELLSVLRHELFHVLLSPFTVFLNTIKPLLRDDGQKADMAENVWTYASEQAVINLERMFRGLTKPQSPNPEIASPMAKLPKAATTSGKNNGGLNTPVSVPKPPKGKGAAKPAMKGAKSKKGC
jgi:hypothetical protein